MRLMVGPIDVHAHHLPIRVIKGLGERHPELSCEYSYDSYSGRVAIRIGDISYKGEVRRGLLSQEEIEREMEKERIATRIISLAPLSFYYHLGPELGLELCSAVNEALASLAEAGRGRIKTLAVVPLQDPSLAVEELRRAIGELGHVGVEIGTNVNGRNLDDPSLRPFFEEVSRSGVPVLIHPCAVAAAERLGSYYLINSIGNPLDTTIAAASIIYGGLLDDFPGLRIILVHGGGFLPYQIGRLDHAYRARPEPRVRARRRPSEYLRSFYFDTITHNGSALEFMVRQVGYDRVVLGSDYPFDMGYTDPLGALEPLELSREEYDAITHGNAARLFGI